MLIHWKKHKDAKLLPAAPEYAAPETTTSGTADPDIELFDVPRVVWISKAPYLDSIGFRLFIGDHNADYDDTWHEDSLCETASK